MKIKSKKVLICEEDVYDITVPEYHNFLIEQGVFAHNCDHPQSVIGGWCQAYAELTVPGSKDVADACCQVVYSAFSNPIQTNLMELAQSMQQRSITQNNMVKPAYYNVAKRPMSQQEAMRKAYAMFNGR